MSLLWVALVERFRFHSDPLESAKNPQQVFLLVLSLIACSGLLRGDAGSATLERSLSNEVVIGWGVCLLIGTSLALAGIFWPRRVTPFGRKVQRDGALALERAGQILTAGAILAYAYVIKKTAPDVDDVRQALAVNVGYGLFCSWRALQITFGLMWRRRHPQAVT